MTAPPDGEERRVLDPGALGEGRGALCEGRGEDGRGGETATLGGNFRGRGAARCMGSSGTSVEGAALKRQQKSGNLENHLNSCSLHVQAPGSPTLQAGVPHQQVASSLAFLLACSPGGPVHQVPDSLSRPSVPRAMSFELLHRASRSSVANGVKVGSRFCCLLAKKFQKGKSPPDGFQTLIFWQQAYP